MAKKELDLAVWVTQLDGKLWGISESKEIAQQFVNGIWQGTWEDVETGSTMMTRAGKFELSEWGVTNTRILEKDQAARQKYGLNPT